MRRVRWQVVEDQKIVEAVRLLGKRWPEIAALLPGRRPCGVKTRWKSAARLNAAAPSREALVRAHDAVARFPTLPSTCT